MVNRQFLFETVPTTIYGALPIGLKANLRFLGVEPDVVQNLLLLGAVFVVADEAVAVKTRIAGKLPLGCGSGAGKATGDGFNLNPIPSDGQLCPIVRLPAFWGGVEPYPNPG